MERIFVQIASYREQETYRTLKDLFERAAYPERIFVGLCWQGDILEYRGWFESPLPHMSQVRTLFFGLEESKGKWWGRMQAQGLWRGEEYVLSIEPQTRFDQDWDKTLIETLARCPSKKPVLTSCPLGYTPPREFAYREGNKATYITISKASLDDPQLVQVEGKIHPKTTKLKGPMPTPVMLNHFFFARSDVMRDVPFDPYIFNYGGEIAYSARLWTHGYDIFQPDSFILYYWWENNPEPKPPYLDWSDARHTRSFMRVKHLFHLKAAPESDAIIELEQYGLGTARTLDAYWKFAGVDLATQTIAAHASEGKWDKPFQALKKPKPKKSAKPKKPAKLPRIFVQIASYRDPQMQWTVKDLFDKAAHPERIFVGVCAQYAFDHDQDCFVVPAPIPKHVRMMKVEAKESKGVCWARRQTQLLWKGEEYTLMIDSHMRFQYGWDELMIRDIALCDSPKAILSVYPGFFKPPHDLEPSPVSAVMHALPSPAGEDIRFCSNAVDAVMQKPLRGAFVAAGFIFGPSAIIKEVPYDPHLYFGQEELSLSARFYTHGWDVYSPGEMYLYHFYNTPENAKKRPLHWSDHTDWGALHELANKRRDHLYGRVISTDPEVLIDMEKYSLGTVRTLQEFSDYTGIDFINLVPSEKAMRSLFIENLKDFRALPIYIPALDDPKPTPPVLAFPDPARAATGTFDQQWLADGTIRTLTRDETAPDGVLVIPDYLDPSLCISLLSQVIGDALPYKALESMAGDVVSIFNDIFCHRVSAFYQYDIDWYDRPHMLRANQGDVPEEWVDAEEWQPGDNTWKRVYDRDYTVFLCLSEGVAESGLHFAHQNVTIPIKRGKLIAFPSDRRYQHHLCTPSSGQDYYIRSWAAISGTPRVNAAPQDVVFIGQRRLVV